MFAMIRCTKNHIFIAKNDLSPLKVIFSLFKIVFPWLMNKLLNVPKYISITMKKRLLNCQSSSTVPIGIIVLSS